MVNEEADSRFLIERVKDQRALARAFREAILRHKQAGNPICVWREGQVVWIAPEDIQIPDEPK